MVQCIIQHCSLYTSVCFLLSVQTLHWSEDLVGFPSFGEEKRLQSDALWGEEETMMVLPSLLSDDKLKLDWSLSQSFSSIIISFDIFSKEKTKIGNYIHWLNGLCKLIWRNAYLKLICRQNWIFINHNKMVIYVIHIVIDMREWWKFLSFAVEPENCSVENSCHLQL